MSEPWKELVGPEDGELRSGGALRMHAYYYGFDKTGVLAIDRILSAVAIAGKSYHHTAQWNEPENSVVECIGRWAGRAAKDFAASRTALLTDLTAEVEGMQMKHEGPDRSVGLSGCPQYGFGDDDAFHDDCDCGASVWNAALTDIVALLHARLKGEG